MALIASDQPSKVVKPCEKALDLPAPPITAKRAAILGEVLSIASIGSNQLNLSFSSESSVEWIAVVGFVANKSGKSTIDKRCIESFLGEGNFVRGSAVDANGDRKTIAVCDCHDLGPFAALGFPDAEPPFLAPLKVPSMKHSARSIPPRSSRSLASARSSLLSVPLRTQAWKRRWHVGYGGYSVGRSFHLAPLRRIHKIPLSTSRGFRHGRPLPSFRTIGRGNSGANISHCASVNFIPIRNQIHDRFATFSSRNRKSQIISITCGHGL